MKVKTNTRKKTLKKALLITFSVLAFLFAVLCVHIYVMMKPKPASPTTVALARIDFKQQINGDDAQKISTWLYSQKGVQHVLCNPESRIAVFSFYPAKTNADNIAANLSTSMHYNAVRYMPSAKEMAQGCPAGYGGASSFSAKVYGVMKNIF